MLETGYRPLFVAILALLVLGMAALVYPATIPHLLHHAADHSGGHTSPMCSWLCLVGAGAVLEAAALPSSPLENPSEGGSSYRLFQSIDEHFSPSRAPPAFLLS